MGLFSFFSKEKKESLDKGLEKTKDSFFSRISKVIAGKSTVDADVLDDLEEILVSSDVGVHTTLRIIERLEERVSKDKYLNTSELSKILKEEVAQLLGATEPEETISQGFGSQSLPHVIMVVGVNGVGKTTTIGKLAYQLKQEGKKVILGAADTFRAAAVDQLNIWADRVQVPIISMPMGTDPASVAFEAVKQGLEQGADVIIVDTAGRLHNKINLMNELSKIKRVMAKLIPDAPHEILLVLDASTGQNAIEQARQFTKATEVNALALTKLDGTAKGGVVLGIVDEFKIPIKYIGVGEKMTDLQLFNKYQFVDSLFQGAL